MPSVTWRAALAAWAGLSVIWVVAIVIRVYRGSIERAERRAALFAADREARAREAVTEERARMARELHDSVGHALNVVVLHAGAAQRMVETKPALAREALESIEAASRQALGDIERMLGILRAPDEDVCCDVTPGMSQLETLCEQVREAGLPVDLDVAGECRVRCPRASTSPRTAWCRRRSPTRSSTPARRGPRCTCATSRMRSRSTCWTTGAGSRRALPGEAAASWACASGSRRSGESWKRDHARKAASPSARASRWNGEG